MVMGKGLTEVQVRNAKAREKGYKVADSRGLHLFVTPAGGKLWRLKYRFPKGADGKEKLLSIGPYPDIGLADARTQADSARKLLVAGTDPGLEKRAAKVTAKIASANTFAAIARQAIERKRANGKASRTIEQDERYLRKWSSIAHFPITDITAPMLLGVLWPIENAGKHETAHRMRAFASLVLDSAMAAGLAQGNPASALRRVMKAPKGGAFAAITQPQAVGELMRQIEGCSADTLTKLALRLLPHVACRPGELRGAEWSEMDLDGATWTIPAERMKARRPHRIALSARAVAILREAQRISGNRRLVFPAARSTERKEYPLSENTLNVALKRLGYGGTMTKRVGHTDDNRELTNVDERLTRRVVRGNLALQRANRQIVCAHHSVERINKIDGNA
jgi:integrase